jgi:hypothetical protein
MSGGSYDYLCFKTAGELSPDSENLQWMIDRLDGLGATAAAARSREVPEKLREVQDLLAELSDVWHAVEWCDSNDWTEEQMRAALARYETDHPQKPE